MNFLYCFFFYQSTVLSSHAVDGHFGGSVIGASTIDIEISPTPPLIFTGEPKSAKFYVV